MSYPNPRSARSLIGIAVAVFSLSACDSKSSNSAQETRQSPFYNQPLSLRTITVADPNSPELLTNGNFSNQLSGWSDCNGTGTVVNNSNAIINPGNCISQGTNASAGQELTLTCSVKRTSAGDPWAGLGLSFYDASGNFISEPTPAQITSTAFTQYTVEGTVPQNAVYVGTWIYTESGVTVENCSLKYSSNEQPPTPPPSNNTELLTNADFSNQLNGWSNCNGTGTVVSNRNAIINAGNCISQSTDVSPNQELTLTCNAKRASAGDAWAGLGLSYYDSNGNFLSEPTPAQITSTNFAQYTVQGTVPQGTASVGTWIYTESGVTVANCSLKANGDQPPPEPPTPPTPPTPPSGDELLSNAGFNNQLNGWTGCSNNPGLYAQNNTAVLEAQNCFYQSVNVTANQDLSLTCSARLLSDSNQWTGIGLSFYDSSWNLISEPNAPQVTGTSFRNYSVSGTTPQGVSHALVWASTPTGMAIDSCSLTTSGTVEPPTPPTPPTPPSNSNFCPGYVESELYRGRSNTIVIGPEQDDWELIIEQAPAGTEILLRDGEYLLDRETIFMTKDDVTVRSLSQNRDGVIIRGLGFYTGVSEGFMIAADRVTIAEMTMYGMRRHAVAMKPELDGDGSLVDTFVYNMNIYDTGTQMVKGSDGGPNTNAIIACNKIGYNPGVARGDYNGAVGMFRGIGIIIRDNYIYNITGDFSGCDVANPGQACIYESTPAIYARESEGTIVERNIILESWRGISLGLVEGHTGGVVRNNFIYRSAPGDMGISIERSSDTLVEHNTVLVNGYWAPIEVKEGTGGHIFRNNLTNLPIQLRGTNGSTLVGNIEYGSDNDLVAPGDPHLRSGSAAIGAGVPSQLSIDFEGDARSGRWDAGADQF